MTQQQPSWDTKSKSLTDEEVVATLRELPTVRLLRALSGFPHIISEVASENSIGKTNTEDLLWMSNRLRLFVLVLQQAWEEELTTKEENK